MANQSKSEGTQHSKGSHRSVAEPPIKLEKNVCAFSKGECVSVKYRTSPEDADSTTYELTIPIFKNGNSKEWLKWVKNVERAAIGQNAMTIPEKFSLAKQLLGDGAL